MKAWRSYSFPFPAGDCDCSTSCPGLMSRRCDVSLQMHHKLTFFTGDVLTCHRRGKAQVLLITLTMAPFSPSVPSERAPCVTVSQQEQYQKEPGGDAAELGFSHHSFHHLTPAVFRLGHCQNVYCEKRNRLLLFHLF